MDSSTKQTVSVIKPQEKPVKLTFLQHKKASDRLRKEFKSCSILDSYEDFEDDLICFNIKHKDKSFTVGYSRKDF